MDMTRSKDRKKAYQDNSSNVSTLNKTWQIQR